jgi:hypothetical protein
MQEGRKGAKSVRQIPAGEVLDSGYARPIAVGPGDECNAAGGL